MALLKIARMGHPVLRAPAEPIADPAAPDIAALIADMVETMEDAGGVGLAAPQVHVARRVAILKIPPARLADDVHDGDAGHDGSHGDAGAVRGDDGTNGAARDGSAAAAPGIELTVMINPEVTPLSDDIDYGWEACLSVPGMAGLVPRHTHIRVSYQTPDGERTTVEAKNFHARVIQHECDHLDGILYPQRMDDLSSFGFAEEIHRSHRAEAAD